MKELARSNVLGVGHVGPVIVSVWFGVAGESDYDLLEKAQADLLTREPRIASIGVVTKVVTEAKASEIGKRRSALLQKRFEDNIEASAVVIAVSGVGGAVARSFAAALNVVNAAKFPNKVFGDVGESVEWIRSLPLVNVKLGDARALSMDVEAYVRSLCR